MLAPQSVGLELTDISKTYDATRALSHVSLRFEPGTIHSLVGHNGSGKSTLVKLLSGVERPTHGKMTLDGRPLGSGSHVPAVHQSLGLVEEISALDNFAVVSHFGTRSFRPISWRRESAAFRKYAQRLEIDLDPSAEVRDLKPVERASIAIMRALRELDRSSSGRSQFLLVDEITTFYSETERDLIAGLLRRVARNGVGVLFISHYLEEVVELSDVVSVLKAGELVGTRAATELDPKSMAAMMFGELRQVRAGGEPNRPAQDHEDTRAWDLAPVLDIHVRPGQILGVTGRAGMGHEHLGYALRKHSSEFRRADPGAGRREQGARRRRGQAPRLMLVPADRATLGVWGAGTITENVTLSTLRQHRVGRLPLINRAAERRFVQSWLDGQALGTQSQAAPISSLSGGNQQKVLVRRSLLAAPDIVVLHEPTQGVDAQARLDLLETVREVARQGTAVVVISNEIQDILDLADAVLVFRNRTVRLLEGDDITEHGIVAVL